MWVQIPPSANKLRDNMKIKRIKKKCKSCKIIKSVDCFNINIINPDNGTIYYIARCKECERKHRKQLYYKNKNSSIRTSAMRKYRYGLTIEQYQNLINEQNSKCKLCDKDINDFNIDHNHKTGKIRGILCNKCNTGLGMFNDDINLLQKAIKYLQ